MLNQDKVKLDLTGVEASSLATRTTELLKLRLKLRVATKIDKSFTFSSASSRVQTRFIGGRPLSNDTRITIASARFENNIAEKEFFCNFQPKLEILNQDTGEYHCRSCDIRWYPEQQ